MQSFADGPPSLLRCRISRAPTGALTRASVQSFTALRSVTKRGPVQGSPSSPAVGKRRRAGACEASFEFCVAAGRHPARSPFGALRRGGTALDAICIFLEFTGGVREQVYWQAASRREFILSGFRSLLSNLAGLISMRASSCCTRL